MTDNGPPRVLVVDDHDLFRSGLRRLLEEEGFEVADARSGDAALATLEWFEADVILMDLNLPGMSGIEATSRALEVQPSASVVILTLARDEASIIQAVRAGAAGYLLKDARLEEIVDAIRAAASGHSVLGNAAAHAVMAYIRAAPTIPAAPALAM